MSSRVRSHIRANVVGYLALFLVLSGGTAQALSGSNTVFSDDIVNGHVRHADLANNSVGTVNIANGRVLNPDLAPNSVGSGKIINGQVKNPDLAPNSVATGKIADGQVKNQDLGPSSVATGKVVDGGLRLDDLAAWQSGAGLGNPSNMVPANGCLNFAPIDAPAAAQPNDLVLVRHLNGGASPLPQVGLDAGASLVQEGGALKLEFWLCNRTASVLASPAPGYGLTVVGVRP